ncbi:MAG TPA: ATP-binding cassette domain-containing protein [Amycolatopsis sp.]|jgi:ABC-type glutathione transport system ATPase component|nr:ATP-binding cassette domain-containing protein [Amycolatopsis sp.]
MPPHERDEAPGDPLLRVENLVKHFRSGRGREPVRAVDGVSFTLEKGTTLAIVGESGSGKSTLARAVLRLVEPDGGTVYYRDENLLTMPAKRLRQARRGLQMIFQDPYSSLHPLRTTGEIIAEPWQVHRGLVPARAQRARVAELLEQVGLPRAYAGLYPSRLSGGERQRIAIARALALRPDILVLDEPVSALDVSIQAQVITLLMRLQRDFGLTYVFISHDLSLVRLVADRVGVLHRGTFVEEGPTEQVYDHPEHEYTQALLAASPALAAT